MLQGVESEIRRIPWAERLRSISYRSCKRFAESSIAVEEHLSLVRGVTENVRTVTPAFAAISAAVVYSTRGSAAYAVYREDQWQRRSKHTGLES
jgi:hypothetical protein